MAKKKAAVSIKPSDMSGGQSLVGQEVTWTNCKTTMYDFNGKADTPQASLQVTLVTEDGNEVDYNWPVFSFKDKKTLDKGESVLDTDWEPDDDETGFVYTGEEENPEIASLCPFGRLMASLVGASFDEDKIENDVSVFEDLKTIMTHLDQGKKKDGTLRRPILVVDEIVSGKKKKDKDSKEENKKGKDEEDDIEEQAQAVVEALLEEHEELKVSKVPSLAMTMVAKNKRKADIIKVLSNEAFYKKSDAWEYDKKTGKISKSE